MTEQIHDLYIREQILNLAVEIGAASSLDHILTVLLSRLDEIVNFDRTSIALIEPGSDEMVVREINYRDPSHADIRTNLGRSLPMKMTNIMGWVALTGNTFLRSSMLEPFNFKKDPEILKVPSHIIAPLIGRRDVLGVLTVSSASEKAYNEVDVAIVSQYAQLAGLSIDNLRTFEQVRELALRDGLTGLYNHRHFHDVLEQELHRINRYGGELTMLMMDLDDFKKFNDNYGHLAGDFILKQFAEVLNRHLRSSDMVFRYGGEEFAVILPATNQTEAASVVQHLLEAIRGENHYQVNNVESASVMTSVGIATAPEDSDSREALIACADSALYQAKDQGKNKAVFFSDISNAY